MDQSSLRAYVNLIQQLLACPSGEEWIVLRQNEALVTPELVQIMEQVASQLSHQGNGQEAKFLHNLAGQIHHLFVAQTVPTSPEDDRAPAYLELIKALLNCPEGEEGEILAAHQDLIGPGLVRRMQQIAAQLAANGDAEAAEYLQRWATELSRLWVQQQNFQPISKPVPAPKHADPMGVVYPEAPPSPGPPPPSFSLPQEGAEDPWAEPSERGMGAIAQPGGYATNAPPSVSAESPLYPQILHQLETIATALTRLSETLTVHAVAPADPLWYMETLERAVAGGWVLTGDEVQQLIGVKPTCPKGQETFQRGCWIFVKVGKLGAQSAWRVEKSPANPD